MATVTLLGAEFTGVTAVVLAVLAALGGGWLGSWITSWKDLEQQRREIDEQARVRMLEAADSFIEAASAALVQLRTLDRSMRAHQQFYGRLERLTLGRVAAEPADAAEGLTPDVRKSVNESRARVSRQLRRVELIFGPASGGVASTAVDAAERAVTRIDVAWVAVQGYYTLLQVSKSESVAQRQEAVEGYTRAATAVGVQYLAPAFPELTVLGTALAGLAGVVAGAVVNVRRPLEVAIDQMTQAMTEAEAALATFTRDASLALVAPPIRRDFEVRYRVGTDEMISPVLVPKQRRLSRAVSWARRSDKNSAPRARDGAPRGDTEGSVPVAGGDGLEGESGREVLEAGDRTD